MLGYNKTPSTWSGFWGWDHPIFSGRLVQHAHWFRFAPVVAERKEVVVNE